MHRQLFGSNFLQLVAAKRKSHPAGLRYIIDIIFYGNRPTAQLIYLSETLYKQ
jgi:hypothetical protein